MSSESVVTFREETGFDPRVEESADPLAPANHNPNKVGVFREKFGYFFSGITLFKLKISRKPTVRSFNTACYQFSKKETA